MIRKFWDWLTGLKPVSDTWLAEHHAQSLCKGWDGPTWRTPSDRLPLWEKREAQ